MDSIKTIILEIIAGIGIFFSAVFYVLFQLKKDENKAEKEALVNSKVDELIEENKLLQKVHKNTKKEKEKNDEDFKKVLNSSGADHVANANNFLQQLKTGTKNNN